MDFKFAVGNSYHTRKDCWVIFAVAFRDFKKPYFLTVGYSSIFSFNGVYPFLISKWEFPIIKIIQISSDK